LNLIDTRRAKKTLKKKGVEFALYYYRNVPAKEDETDIFAPIVENDAASPERKQLSELSDGGKNLWGSVVQRYLARIKTIHKGTSPYHPRTNGKVEALNGLIGSMLTKLLLGKSTKLWDLYLDQALFACRVRTHSTTKTSPFYLVYGKHPRLLGDQNIALAIDAVTANHEARIQAVGSARQEAAQASYERAWQAKTIRDELVKEHELSEGEWVLVRHESAQKFETKWFGPYRRKDGSRYASTSKIPMAMSCRL